MAQAALHCFVPDYRRQLAGRGRLGAIAALPYMASLWAGPALACPPPASYCDPPPSVFRQGSSRCAIYVDDNAACDPGPFNPAVSDSAEDGTCAHPYDTLEEALVNSAFCDLVLVRAGTYFPDSPGSNNFDIGDLAIEIIGLDGPEVTTIVPSNPATDVVKISGNTHLILDGLTIQGSGDPEYNRSGLWIDSSSVNIRRCIIHEHREHGIDITSYDSASNVTIEDCVIRNNGRPGLAEGGGVRAAAGQALRVRGSVFEQNTAVVGGAIWVPLQQDATHIERCYFRANRACELDSRTGDCAEQVSGPTAGAVYVAPPSQLASSASADDCCAAPVEIRDGADDGPFCAAECSPLILLHCARIENSVFDGNVSYCQAGAVQSVLAKLEVVNCTFAGNTAYGELECGTTTCCGRVGALFGRHSSTRITNSIFWDNLAQANQGHALGFYGGCATIGYSTLQGGAGGVYATGTLTTEGVILTGDPLFADLDGLDGSRQDDLRLRPTSPAINMGLNSDSLVTDDLDGAVRRVGGMNCQGGETPPCLDQGAYEAHTQIFIDRSAPGNHGHDGKSWQTAYTDLKPHLDSAAANTVFWVAAGTYKPAGVGGSRSASFALKNNVRVYGGFRGWDDATGNKGGDEVILNERNLDAHKVLLSGDLNGNDTGAPTHPTHGENSYHVVTAANTDATALLSGVRVTAGFANGAGATDKQGAGFHTLGGSPTLIDTRFVANGGVAGSGSGAGSYSGPGGSPSYVRCRFEGNEGTFGAGTASNGSTATFEECAFVRNTGTTYAGAMYNVSSNVSVASSIFYGNTVPSGANPTGGAVFNRSSAQPLFTNCKFLANEAGRYGGAIANTNSSPLVTNSLFVGNKTTQSSADGGAIYNTGSSDPQIRNCTFTDNSVASGGSGSDGGAIHNASTTSNPSIADCVFWGNSDFGGTDESAQIYDVIPGLSSVSYSLIQDCSGAGFCANPALKNIGSAPWFADRNGCDNVLGTLDDNPRLLPGSPGIDAGSNLVVPADAADLDDDGDVVERIPLDLDLSVRFVEQPCVKNSGAPDPGPPPYPYIVDMGAFETQIGPEPLPVMVNEPDQLELACQPDPQSDYAILVIRDPAGPTFSGYLQAGPDSGCLADLPVFNSNQDWGCPFGPYLGDPWGNCEGTNPIVPAAQYHVFTVTAEACPYRYSCPALAITPGSLRTPLGRLGKK